MGKGWELWQWFWVRVTCGNSSAGRGIDISTGWWAVGTLPLNNLKRERYVRLETPGMGTIGEVFYCHGGCLCLTWEVSTSRSLLF